MADTKISALPASAGLALADLLAVVDDPGGTPVTQKATLTQLSTLLNTLYVAKAGDTMTGLLTIAQATANTSALVSTGYSLTGANAQSLLSLAGTWNTSGSPAAINLNITDTASASGSRLLDFRVGGAVMFQIEKSGLINACNSIVFAMNADNTPMFTGAGVAISGTASTVVAEFNSGWTTTGTPTSLQVDVLFDFGPSGAESFLFNAKYAAVSAFSIRKDGLVRVFNRINFLGDTSSFPSLKRSATVLQSRLADDSNFSPLQGLLRTAANAVTGLGAGVLAATTNATIVITDASGQAYRVPCII